MQEAVTSKAWVVMSETLAEMSDIADDVGHHQRRQRPETHCQAVSGASQPNPYVRAQFRVALCLGLLVAVIKRRKIHSGPNRDAMDRAATEDAETYRGNLFCSLEGWRASRTHARRPLREQDCATAMGSAAATDRVGPRCRKEPFRLKIWSRVIPYAR